MCRKYLILAVFSFTGYLLVHTDTVQLCGSKMTVQRGSYSDFESHNVVRDVRSVVECATLCHAEVECQSAVYKRDKTCHLIESTSDVVVLSSTNQFTSDYLLQPEDYGCSSTCEGDSACVLVCSSGGSPEAVCVDLSGTQDDCNFSPAAQLKEYYLSRLNEASSQDNHVYFAVTFTKLYQSTSLRVMFRGTLRGGFGGTNSYGLWEILFNGTSCNNPGKIESLHFNQESDVSHHRASGIHGICEDLNMGIVEITLTARLFNSAIFHVGHLTEASRLFVEEFEQPGAIQSSACPSLSSFNAKEEVFYLASDQHVDSVPLWNTTYLKMENDTSLKINLDFVIRMSTMTERCAMWSILVDNNDCQPLPFGKVLGYLSGWSRLQNEHLSVEVEGYCDDIPAGAIEISLHIQNCVNEAFGTAGAYTGWPGNITQRIIIEEYSAESNINSVVAPDGKTISRLPQMNVVTFGAFHLDMDPNDGLVWDLGNYRKLYASSGLRLSMSGGVRAQAKSEGCCRYFFVIDSAECYSPGPIEGIVSLSVDINLHRPILIEGICEGIAAGDVELSIHVGACKDQLSTANCFFGWRSYDQVMASEVYTDREVLYL